MVIDELPALPKPAANLSAARIGSTVYVVAAGRSAGSDRLNEKYFWSLDLALLTNGRTATWNPLPTWPGPPRHQAIVAVQAFGNGQENLFLFSGSNPHFFSDGSPDLENFEYYSDAYRYDPTREVWTSVADLPVVEDDRDLPNRQQFAGQRRPVAAGAGIGLSSIFPTQSTGSGSAISIEMEG
ncbi:hypothetical protein [Aeoliella sp.]|uniref:hypothetical protein n=1 Tax=Aeoliella sp. TaxID=2795800 RepID=UPI003CCBEB3C